MEPNAIILANEDDFLTNLCSLLQGIDLYAMLWGFVISSMFATILYVFYFVEELYKYTRQVKKDSRASYKSLSETFERDTNYLKNAVENLSNMMYSLNLSVYTMANIEIKNNTEEINKKLLEYMNNYTYLKEEQEKTMNILNNFGKDFNGNYIDNLTILINEFKKISEYIAILKAHFPQLQDRIVSIGGDKTSLDEISWIPTFGNTGDNIVVKYNIIDIITNKPLNEQEQILSLVLPEVKEISIPAGTKLVIVSAKNKSSRKFIHPRDITNYAKDALELKTRF